MKIAIPPPRGTMSLWYLSCDGWAAKPARVASFFVTAVRITDRIKEPNSKISADIVVVSILIAPVIGF